MAPGVKLFSLFLMITALSGAILCAQTQLRDRQQPVRTSPDQRPERPVRPTKPEGPARDPASDNGDRNRPARNPVVDQRPERPVRPSDVVNPVSTPPIEVVLIPVAVPIADPPQSYLGVEYSDEEIITNYLDDPLFDYFNGWTPRWKIGHTATITSYGMGVHLMIPAGTTRNSELFVGLGTMLFSKSQDFVIDGIDYESRGILLPLSLMLKTTHLSGNNSYGEYRIYSALGGGPAVGFAYPSSLEAGMTRQYSRWALAGEFFGALGAEFVLKNNVGYYAEAGFSYINFAGRSFSTTQQILSPTLSIGIRFY